MHMKWKSLLVALGLIGFFITSRAFTQGRKAQTGLVPELQTKLIAARATDAAPPSGDVQENAKDGLKYVRIPAGTFRMGCSPGDEECQPDEKPSHEVTITKDFWIGQTEVTVGAYKHFIAATKRQIQAAPSFNQDWANEIMPIVSVTWDESRDYCVWAGGRLPTEAEWEYAARGGSTQARYGSLAEIASSSPYGSLPRVVGQKRPNGFGLFDVLGNASEWVNDWYDEKYYQHSPSKDPTGPEGDGSRVLRGGPLTATPWIVRVSYRDRKDPGGRDFYDSFRCVWEGAGR
jgi:formylglycine-generating enzyme required for sulfatase activity